MADMEWRRCDTELHHQAPPRYSWIWIWRKEWDAPVKRIWSTLDPAMNVQKLYWHADQSEAPPPPTVEEE